MEGIRMQQYQNNRFDEPGYTADPDAQFRDYVSEVNRKVREENRKKRPARIMNTISTILTILGSMCVAFCCCLYPNLLINDSIFLRQFNFVGMTIGLICITLVPSIIISVINKIKNPKNTTALVVIIIDAVVILIAAIVFISFGIDKEVRPKNYSRDVTAVVDIPYYDEIVSCMDSHGFDVVVRDESRSGWNAFGWDYDIDLYISSEASPEKLAEVNKFLKELRDICKKANKTKETRDGMIISVRLYYYCADEEEFYTQIPITIKEHVTDDFLIIEDKIDYITSHNSKYAGSINTEPNTYHDAFIVVK